MSGHYFQPEYILSPILCLLYEHYDCLAYLFLAVLLFVFYNSLSRTRRRAAGVLLVIVFLVSCSMVHEFKYYKDRHIEDVKISTWGAWTHFNFPPLPRAITGPVNHGSLATHPDCVVSVFEDGDLLWVGTFGSGLWCLDTKSGKWE